MNEQEITELELELINSYGTKNVNKFDQILTLFKVIEQLYNEIDNDDLKQQVRCELVLR